MSMYLCVCVEVGGIYGRKNRNVNMEREVNAWELVWRKLDTYVEASATGTANVKGVYMGDTVGVQQCMLGKTTVFHLSRLLMPELFLLAAGIAYGIIPPATGLMKAFPTRGRGQSFYFKNPHSSHLPHRLLSSYSCAGFTEQ